MPLTIRASGLAPDVRFGLVRVMADPGWVMVVGDMALHVEGCLPQASGIPAYLRYSDRDAMIVADGVDDAAELELLLAASIPVLGESDAGDDLSVTVMALDAVDRCFRASGTWRGNIYLAGAEALTAVLALVGAAGHVSREPHVVLRELAALELAYLFPIAGKFRLGAYDGKVQYRLNGWGRALAGALASGQGGAARAAGYLRRLSDHLAGEQERYGSLLSRLDVARQDYEGNLLDEALALPIPVLV